MFVLRFFLSAFGILEFAGYVMLLPLLSYVSKKNAKAKQARHDDHLEFLKNKEEYLASDWTREEEAEER